MRLTVLFNENIHDYVMYLIKYLEPTIDKYTGRFIIYSRITKSYDRKTVGHVFMKLVQIEGTTKNFFPRKLFFIAVHISAAR
jgi:hypothetical protein